MNRTVDVQTTLTVNRATRHRVSFVVAGFGVCVLLWATRLVFAQSGGGYDMMGNVQNTGGVKLTGANGYSLNGTIGQPSATNLGEVVGGNAYALSGGFWPDVYESDVVFRNGFESVQ